MKNTNLNGSVFSVSFFEKLADPILNFILLLMFITIQASGFSQTTSIGETINSYAKVRSIKCASKGELTVANIGDFKVGQKVLLIQAKGASIDESNTEKFGEILELNGAGLYEINQIKEIDGRTIILEKSINGNFNPSGALQLVSIPEYFVANITSTLTAPQWDGETGGVIIFFAEHVILNADIDASGLGMRGAERPEIGVAAKFASFYAPKGSGAAGIKGEGIADPISKKENGKGALANGGGGGNSFNAGGGGGANIGAGGIGGVAPKQPLTTRGLGGRSLEKAYDNKRIFFGGGGGSGHQNNAQGGRGGFGGGMVIIKTKSLSGNKHKISANGIPGEDAEDNDGAGGGGAAGTILIEATGMNGPLTIEAIGGQGGDNPADHGTGGGGGGGLIFTNATFPKSIEMNTMAGPSGSFRGDVKEATNGQIGKITTGLYLNFAKNHNVEICNNGLDDDCDGDIDCFDSECANAISCRDFDKDGIADKDDLDDDNDGIPDSLEGTDCFEASLNFELYDYVIDPNSTLKKMFLDPSQLGVVDEFVKDNSAGILKDNPQEYTIDYSGFLNIEQAADYTFYMTADAGSQLKINGYEVLIQKNADNCGQCQGAVFLEKGYAKIELLNQVRKANACLRLEYEHKEMERQEIPFSKFSGQLCDPDHDGLQSSLDIDSDGDGIPDNVEAQALNEYKAPTGADIDNDGLLDVYDPDCSPCEANGTSLFPVNTDEIDQPDYLDLDSDNDGTTDSIEAWDENKDGKADANPLHQDNDKDGLDDGYDKDYARRSEFDSSNEIRFSNFPNKNRKGEPNWRDASIAKSVEVLFFNAIPNDDQVVLEWINDTELNSDYFLIEKSLDNHTWENFAVEKAQASTYSLSYYTLIDEDPFPGINHYRLTQFDLDGRSTKSVKALASVSKTADYVIYPNPARDFIKIRGIEEANGNAKTEIHLYDIRGKQIPIEIDHSGSEVSITFSNSIQSGNYLLRVNEQSFIVQIFPF